MLKPGTILDDRYEIIDVVGTGGMSTVYRAKDERLKRFVAIKVLKSDYSSDQNFVSKFRAEAQSSAGLTHPNIVSVYDVCEDDGRYFIVMELVEGITLKEFINLNGRLNMQQALDFSIQIASGLEAAHEHHVIHRDIKPQNIIVSKSGNIKVTDFGIAKAATSTTMSTTGIGSVHYISPEQARGGYSDERSDIYSLGITMYEMVTGRVPFEGDTNVAIALMHIQNDMIPPRQLYPDIFPSFEKIILKATQKKPERRYLTAAALIADLNRVKDNPNIDIIVAPPTIPGGPTQQFTREQMEQIKNGSAIKGYEPEEPVRNDASQLASSEVRPDRSRIDELLNQKDEDFYDDYDDEPFDRPKSNGSRGSKGGIKRVSDEYDDDDRYSKDSRYDDEYDDDEEDVDPKLEKAVMIGGIAAAIIIAVLVFAFVGNAMGWFSFGKKNKSTTESTVTTEEVKNIKMMNLVGLSQKAAEKDLKEAGFKNYKFVEQNSVDVREGYVISQNVEEGKEIPKDTELIITVSVGAEELTVSDVKGMDEDEAYTVLEKQGFKPTRSYKFDDEIEDGKVISTDPKAGSSLKAGESIVIYVSQGKEEKTVAVPDLSGLSEATAKGNLESNKLKVGNVTYEFNSDVDAGLVIRQSVSAGTEVKEGTSVDFVISNGPEKKTYKVKVSGSISTKDEDLIGVTVTVRVYINDSEGTHEVYSTTEAGDSIEVGGALGGLANNNGTVSYTVTTADGMDVSSSYSNSLTVNYEEE
ncbi:MAG: Stk1 family PASTA domain-containing Ser/Thr kinase [Eubacterium sp.]|nr:Stk1 family PASTA domain-containing Ser/Thr kinase [Eubacterium sp.]